MLLIKVVSKYYKNIYFKQDFTLKVWTVCRTVVRKKQTNCNNHNNIIQDKLESELPKAYNPKDFEFGWYDWWEKNGYFKPSEQGEPFSIVLPPPNVTGTLHLGHAFTGTIQDVISRWKRMQGCSVLWIPGVDHAGIATQVVVEKRLMNEENKTKHDVGKSEFVKRVWNWKDEKGNAIIEQLRTLGLSLDWSRQVFTMDEEPSRAVKEAFISLFDTGVIYRKEAFVNWSCALQSSISDIEVETLEIAGPTKIRLPNCKEPVEFGIIYEIGYRLHNEDGEVVVATTRPETFLGDTAVALHPDDPRRRQLQGKSVWHPFQCRPIPIIFDSFVSQSFGTGAVKITPAHDPQDWEVGQRHSLPTLRVFDESGTILISKFKGLKRYQARSAILDELKDLGLFYGTKTHSMQLPICSRSGDVIELMLKPQWFLNCKEAALKAVNAVKNGELSLNPINYDKVWFHWLENSRDWNISRQLWWGHPIPAYEVTGRNGDSAVWVAASSIEEAKKKAAPLLGISEKEIGKVVPDDDVLDTWFSSALFPLYSLHWPNQSPEFDKRYPFSLLDTAHDILFFWVARMVMLSFMLKDRLPFKCVLLHGIICDAQGRKMSKSLGNVLAPEDVIYGCTAKTLAESIHENHKRGIVTSEELKISLAGQKKLFPNGIPECGVDALRFTLCSQAVQSHFVSFDVSTCHANKLFCNKIFQAFKFFLIGMENEKVPVEYTPSQKSMNGFDLWIFSRLAAAISEISKAMETYQLHLVTAALKRFIYHEMCDVYLEAAKPVLRFGDGDARQATLTTLFRCIETSLRLLHPIMPFVTEEVYQRLPNVKDFQRSESIMIAPYPEFSDWKNWVNLELDETVGKVNDVVSSVRKVKALLGTKGEKPDVFVSTSDKALVEFMNSHLSTVKILSRATTITVVKQNNYEPTGNFHKERIDDKTYVYTSFQNDMENRIHRLEPTLKREGKLIEQMQKLRELLSKKQLFEQTSSESQNNLLQKINVLERELLKIQEMKKLLQ